MSAVDQSGDLTWALAQDKGDSKRGACLVSSCMVDRSVVLIHGRINVGIARAHA